MEFQFAMSNLSKRHYTSLSGELRFDWDDGNDSKSLAKLGISTEAIEAFFEAELSISEDPKHSQHEPRFLAVGLSKEGRSVIVSFTIRIKEGDRCVRPISARYMHVKE